MSGGLKDRGAGPEQRALFAEVDHRAGHRQRLKDRFANAGPEALPDYELLELVLFAAIPRRDTKPLAKALLDRFGSFAEVINAPPERLREVKGIGDAAITQLKLVRAGALRIMQGSIMQRPVLGSWNSVLDYCRAAMGFEAQEQFRILFLDKKNRLIADEVQQRGTIDHTPVYPREVVKRALELSATALILVHNHPSGDPTPSADDLRITAELAEAGRLLDIELLDHVVIGAEGWVSLRSLGATAGSG